MMFMWTIYDRPKDYPYACVARKFRITAGSPGPEPTTDVLLADTLDQLRRYFAERGLTCLPRADSDDPVIVETWM